jgi:hypothetical protein
MKTILVLILVALLTLPTYSWTPDTTKTLWNRDFIIEFGYGYSYVSMNDLNKYYLDDWAKQMGYFDKKFHFCSFLTPEFGLIFTNNIISVSYQTSNSIITGKEQKDVSGYSFQPNLYVSFWTFNGTYRRLFTANPFLIGLGTSISIGKGSAYVGSQSYYEMAKQDKRLSEGMGGGGTIFSELDYVFLKHLLFGLRIGANILLTETLHSKDMGKWIIDETGHEINLDYSGLSCSMRIGFLW